MILKWVPCCRTKGAWLPAKDMRGSSLRYEGMTQSVN